VASHQLGDFRGAATLERDDAQSGERASPRH
jgi:hypothetical protein